MTRRFWIGGVLSLPVLALEMGGHLTNLHMLLGKIPSNWIQFALATPVVLWAGWPFFVRGYRSLLTRNLNMFTLIAMGVGVAYGYSVIAVLLPDLFPAAFRDAEGAVAVYFEAAAVITVLVLLGQVLELRAREATSGAIKALLGLAPKTARRVKGDNSDEEVSLDAINVGDRLRVRPGDKVPVDGTVLEGRSSLYESMVTGEFYAGDQRVFQRNRCHAQHVREFRDARRQGRPRHTAGPNRADGGQGPAQPRANPTARRPSRRLVRAGGNRCCSDCICRVGDVRAGAAFRLLVWSPRSAC